MAKGGLVMDVTDADQARIAEEAGVSGPISSQNHLLDHNSVWCDGYLQACAVMALERVPADIRKDGGVARMTDPKVSITINLII